MRIGQFDVTEESDKNLNNAFIRASHSPAAPPIGRNLPYSSSQKASKACQNNTIVYHFCCFCLGVQEFRIGLLHTQFSCPTISIAGHIQAVT